jgi:L-ribulose-5-phosphate 3-epimerase
MSKPWSRRSFLACSALGGAALTSPASALTQACRAPSPFRKAVKYNMIAGSQSVRDKFQLLKDLGFDGVELDSPNGLDRQEVLDARDATGLPIHGVVDSMHWGKPFSHPDEKVRKAGLQALETALRDCQAYGGSTVLVVPAVVNKQVSYAKAWDRSTTEIAKLVPLAEQLKVKIAFENVWNNFLLSPLEMAHYIDSFESTSVGSYLDVGNLVRYAWPEHWVEALGKRIFKVDVKGYSRKKQNNEGLWKGFEVKIGEGDEDWPTVNRALLKVGYQGWFTAEVGGGGTERLTAIAAAMDRVMSIPE